MRTPTTPPPATAPEDQWLTPAQVCARLQVTRDWLYDRCQANKIPYIRLGRHLRFNEAVLNEWIKEHAE